MGIGDVVAIVGETLMEKLWYNRSWLRKEGYVHLIPFVLMIYMIDDG